MTDDFGCLDRFPLRGNEMIKTKYVAALAFGIFAASGISDAGATEFNIPASDLKSALDAYAKQSGIALIVSDEAVKGSRSEGAKGDLTSDAALAHILAGTGFVMYRHSANVIGIGRASRSSENFSRGDIASDRIAAAVAPTATGAALETVTVTSSKIGGDVQNIPIAITALSQEQLTSTQTAGGPDLVKQVPNLTF